MLLFYLGGMHCEEAAELFTSQIRLSLFQSPWSPVGAGSRCQKWLSKFLALWVLSASGATGIRYLKGWAWLTPVPQPPASSCHRALWRAAPSFRSGGVCGRPIPHPSACARGVSSSKGALAWSGSHCSGLDPWKPGLERVDECILVCHKHWCAVLGLCISPEPYVSLFSRQPQPKAPCEQQ